MGTSGLVKPSPSSTAPIAGRGLVHLRPIPTASHPQQACDSTCPRPGGSTGIRSQKGCLVPVPSSIHPHGTPTSRGSVFSLWGWKAFKGHGQTHSLSLPLSHLPAGHVKAHPAHNFLLVPTAQLDLSSIPVLSLSSLCRLLSSSFLCSWGILPGLLGCYSVLCKWFLVSSKLPALATSSLSLIHRFWFSSPHKFTHSLSNHLCSLL